MQESKQSAPGHIAIVTRISTLPWIVRLIGPDRVVRTRRLVGARGPIRMLDVGCGNHSVSYFRAAFPHCNYVGVDQRPYNLTPREISMMDRFIMADLDTSNPFDEHIGKFDLIVVAHILEHLREGMGLVRALCNLVRPGGLLYTCFPTPHSVEFPRRTGTLNFFDDPTHVTLINPAAIESALVESGLEVVTSCRSRPAAGLIMFPLRVVAAPFTGGVTGPMLWSLYGFEHVVIGRKPKLGAS